METPQPKRAKIDQVAETFDVVVVAHPLERSSLQFEGIPDAPSAAQLGKFRRCVAHFVRGVLRPEYFGLDPSEHPPLEVLTVAGSSAPFYSIGLQYPVRLSSAQDIQDVIGGAFRREPQVYKVFAPRALTETQLLEVFSPGGDGDSLKFEVVGWYAYPEYEVPQRMSPFVFDGDGVFYINAIEQAASAMEMSVISARNAANLVRRLARQWQADGKL